MKRKGTYIVIQDWMTCGLHLKNTELLVFAIIYGFSQARGNWFTGSCDYICKRIGVGKSAVYDAMHKLLTKKLLIKQEIKSGFVKHCCYAYNYELVDNIINTYEGISEEDLDDWSSNLLLESKSPIPETNVDITIPETNVVIPETNVAVPESNVAIPETNVNNKYINKINNKNIIKTKSQISSKQNPFDKTLKEIQKEEKEIKKQIKNKTELLEKVSLEEITTETLSDINNLEVQKNREMLLERAAQRQASANTAKLNNIKKARLNRAKELFPETEILNLLDKFIDGYQYSKNIMPKEAWELILERLLTIPENKRVQAIKDSIEKNYRSIYYNESYQKSDFDNTRGHEVDKKALHELSTEEKMEFDQKLARNADGSYMVF